MGEKHYFGIVVKSLSILELDEDVIDVVDDDWRSNLYDIHTPEEIAEMVGRCMVVHRLPLSSLDGWADQPDDNAKLIFGPAWDNAIVRKMTLEERDNTLAQLGVVDHDNVD